MLIPPIYFGINTTSQLIDLYDMHLNLTFMRPWDTGFEKINKAMVLNETMKLNVKFNFGIYENENSTSTDFFYGVKEDKEIVETQVLIATRASRLSFLPIALALVLMSYN